MKIHIGALALGLGLTLAFTAACSKKSSKSTTTTAEETSIKLTGTLALSGETTGLHLTGTALTDLSVYCVTFTLPPIAGTGEIDADGKFSVTLATTGVSVGCFILDAEKAILGTMVFKDPSKKDLNGADKSADRFALDGGESNLGSITLNLATGKAEVDVSKIVGKAKDTTKALADAYDFTGAYTFEESGAAAPEGYANLCSEAEAAAERNSNDSDRKCNGPSIGMPIYMKRIKGVVPNTSTPAYAMAFWASKSLDTLCGNKLGVSYADGISHGIDFTNSGVAEGDFSWDPAYQDGWKDVAHARARNSMLKQENVADFNGYPGTKQYFKQYRTFNCNNNGCTDGTPIVAEGFQFNANTNDTGCKNVATGKGVQMNDWSNMKCENTALPGGLRKNVCTKTVDSVEVSCTNISGTYLANGNPVENAITRYPQDYIVLAQGAYCDNNSNNVFDGNEWPMWNGNTQSCADASKLKQGDLCSAISTTTEEGKLAQLRCYAENRQGGDGGDSEMTSCQREVRTNWGAKTSAEFVSGKSKPKGQFVFELLEYDSATSASIRGEETDYRGVQVGDNFTDCEVQNVFSFSMKKIDDSGDLYGEMIETETNVSLKPACANVIEASKARKYMFKMKKKAE